MIKTNIEKIGTKDKAGVIAAEKNFVVLYKPHFMHTVPLKKGEGGTLLEWAALQFPKILEVRGKKIIEGGILHRLDFETAGIVLAATEQSFYDALVKQQSDGFFVKEYEAISAPQQNSSLFEKNFCVCEKKLCDIKVIESGFRAWGKGRKAVRPTSNGVIYKTEILHKEKICDSENYLFRVRLQKGFRHQIRCHLAWVGFPILNDALYGGLCSSADALSLNAISIKFIDPLTNDERTFATV
jgi:23S rRNA pseudouridine1911/1915/1917 synthase